MMEHRDIDATKTSILRDNDGERRKRKDYGTQKTKRESD
jgi:phage baseplate assembly protein W